jgi:DNA-binding beta-propeller fold protein YncE
LPQLRRLERKYAQEVIVIGVHSAKFPAEKETEAVRQAVRRHGVEHAVVNDRDFRIWQEYAVHAWPTLMFIDPHGNVMGRHEGEFDIQALMQILDEMIAEFENDGGLQRGPLPFRVMREESPGSLLSFPGKVLADAEGKRLFVADTGHHRIVELSLPEGQPQHIFGNGEPGFTNGDGMDARFHSPEGLALSGEFLYVADTENHALRAIDLAERHVTTIAGTGVQAQRRHPGGEGRAVALNSPWDLAVLGERLYVAMAGFHQIWEMNLATGRIFSWAGSGHENLADGPLAEAMLAQPSGLALDPARGKLYVADSEVSAIRSIDLAPGGRVHTLVGEGLFEFGDQDGIGPEVRLQHPLAVAIHGGILYVADSYNHKIKRLDVETGAVTTFLGNGLAGMRNGKERTAEFAEPGGLSVASGHLYIADTNNHAIRICDLTTGEVYTLPVS